MIPIARDTGTVIAFGGRALESDQQPKYLNSPETPIYTKSRTLYGLNLTKSRPAQRQLRADRRRLFRFRAGAPGRRLSGDCDVRHGADVQQAQMLRRFAAKAVLCYDADRAGQTAAERSSELLVAEGFDVNVVQLPGGDDPDTFLQKHGRDAFVGAAQAVAAVSGVPARSRGGRTRPDARRQPA